MCPHRGSRVNTRRGSKTGGLPVRSTVCTCVCVWVVCVYLCSCQALWPITRSPAFRWFTIVEIPFLTYTTLLFQRPDPSSTTELHQLLISLLQRKKKGGGDKDIKLYIYSLPPEKLHRTLCAVQKSVINMSMDAWPVWRWVSYQVSTASFDWAFPQESPDHPMPNTNIPRIKTIVVFQFHFWAKARRFSLKLLSFVA